ncbi:glycosyl hydrolase family 71-domain-containing protein [Microdochium trichocladiopsis]|uniref:Glycosyl hydrolase family 71-domain-containing protein n=1 Tax=Microdochium trichocladiopsis TaxID=1682393 RepID=A0A9P8YAS6_9PEZI|nr:glycosyl hydrolase family 71-domain-containing protein [Microdochium trichocladiopsis]KAH7033736.1 glycosyl hydrolase family 71-domain-containing protein [Microdochium trichocladiopsis]
MKLLHLLAPILAARLVEAKAVFAHYMVGNCDPATFSVADWKTDIGLAQAAHIDAFALNIAANSPFNDQSIANAFDAAGALGFHLFFSFDYAGGGAWPASSVKSLLNQYKGHGAYYLYNGKPFASTFEGWQNSADWVDIRASTNAFFMPDWSSKSAKEALELTPGVTDGLFSWAAWPYGADDMYTVVDNSYTTFLKGAPYMMPQVLTIQPEFVEIISWNDFGESHYIGPLWESQYTTNFGAGNPPYNYAKDHPHDSWRQLLPFYIDMYKNNNSAVGQEAVVGWYRPIVGSACTTGGTTANTMSQVQCEQAPDTVVQDRVFVDALLAGEKPGTVTIGGVSQGITWENKPVGGIGIYHGSVPFNGNTGPVTVSVSGVGSFDGPAITTSCTNNIQNYNAWTGYAKGAGSGATPSTRVEDMVCVQGRGIGNYKGLCEFTCSYGYCPPVCTCSQLGIARPLPDPVNVDSYPVGGLDVTYGGLCSFACNRGYCPAGTCTLTQEPLGPIPDVPPFPLCYPPDDAPKPDQVCIGGSGEGGYAGLCDFSCNHGFCPSPCKCLAYGDPIPPPANTGNTGCGSTTDLSNLCAFTCLHGYCPSGVCFSAPGDFVCPSTGGQFFQVGGDKQPNASCNDIKGQIAQAAYYNAVDAGNQYSKWWGLTPDASMEAFATPYGNGQSMICTIADPCSRPNCNSLDNPAEPGTAWPYLVELSAANFNAFMTAHFNALTDARASYATLQQAINSNFWSQRPDENVLTKEILNAMTTALFLGMSWGKELGGAFASLMSGASSAFMLQMKASQDQLAQLAKEEVIAKTMVDGFKNQIEDIFNGIINKGIYIYTDVTGSQWFISSYWMFENGQWVDQRNIPLLSGEVSNLDLANYYYSITAAAVMNYAWKQQNTYIMCHPMTEDEFNNLKVLGIKTVQPVNPHGWGSLQSSDFPWSVWDVIKGSVDAFNAGGFLYDPGNVEVAGVGSGSTQPRYDLPTVFNIPICMIAPKFGTYTAKEFVKLLLLLGRER